MFDSKEKPALPERPSLEWLKRLAKEHLAELRRNDPSAKLALAQLAIAQRYGFSSWRALKSEVDARRAPELAAFFAACDAGDVGALGRLLSLQPNLVHIRNATGETGLHLAARHERAVRLLLERGADPNARDTADNASPLHVAAAKGAIGAVRALLDAGADVNAEDDVHRAGVIGWVTLFGSAIDREVLDLLLARGARHHIFSAIAVRDAGLVQRIVEDEPEALNRRLSRFEQRQTPLHYVVAPPDGLIGGGFRTGQHYELLELLIELGADLEAEDDKGRTPLGVAMLSGDREAMRRLHAAGALVPRQPSDGPSDASLVSLASSVRKLDPMLRVKDMAMTIAWYRSIGFQLSGTHEQDGVVDWAGLSLGHGYVMVVPGGNPAAKSDVTLFLRTDRIDEFYQALKQRQLDRAARTLAGQTPSEPEVRFAGDIYDAHYGARTFSIVDPDGYVLNFTSP